VISNIHLNKDLALIPKLQFDSIVVNLSITLLENNSHTLNDFAEKASSMVVSYRKGVSVIVELCFRFCWPFTGESCWS